MAEFPNLRTLASDLCWVIRGKLGDALGWFRNYVESEYRKPGPRDDHPRTG